MRHFRRTKALIAASFFASTMCISIDAPAVEAFCTAGDPFWLSNPTLTVWSEVSTGSLEFLLPGTLSSVNVVWNHTTSQLAAVYPNAVTKGVGSFAFQFNVLISAPIATYRQDTDAFFGFGVFEDSCNGPPGTFVP